MGNKPSYSSRTPQKSPTPKKWGKAGKWGDTCPKTKPVGDSDWDVPSGSYKMYQTHDNGGRIFRVFVDSKDKVAVITLMTPSEWPDHCYPYVVNKRFPFQRVFIGKSPRNEMTENAFMGGFGPKFDGNSILFDMGNNTYMYVGESVKLFQTHTPILRYVSPVGQNDVPYPYAVDEEGVYYLMAEDVKIKLKKGALMMGDPYDLYYDEGEKRRKSLSEQPIEFNVLVPRLV